MSFDILERIGKTSGIIDQRFLIGLFFPLFVGSLSLNLVLFKSLPYQLEDWTYIIAISFGISVVLNQFSPRLCWYFTMAERRYKKYLQNNFDSFFVDPVIKEISEFNIDPSLYKKKVRENIPFFCHKAKSKYYSNFFIEDKKRSTEKLNSSETRFLMQMTFTFVFTFNLLLTALFIYTDVDFILFFRDRIVSSIGYVIIVFFSFLAILSAISSIFISNSLWESIILSVNTPFKEDEHERTTRESILETILKLSEQPIIRENTEVLSNLLKAYTFESYNWILKEITVKNSLRSFIEELREDLKITENQAKILELKLSEQKGSQRDVYIFNPSSDNKSQEVEEQIKMILEDYQIEYYKPEYFELAHKAGSIGTWMDDNIKSSRSVIYICRKLPYKPREEHMSINVHRMFLNYAFSFDIPIIPIVVGKEVNIPFELQNLPFLIWTEDMQLNRFKLFSFLISAIPMFIETLIPSLLKKNQKILMEFLREENKEEICISRDDISLLERNIEIQDFFKTIYLERKIFSLCIVLKEGNISLRYDWA